MCVSKYCEHKAHSKTKHKKRGRIQNEKSFKISKNFKVLEHSIVEAYLRYEVNYSHRKCEKFRGGVTLKEDMKTET